MSIQALVDESTEWALLAPRGYAALPTDPKFIAMAPIDADKGSAYLPGENEGDDARTVYVLVLHGNARRCEEVGRLRGWAEFPNCSGLLVQNVGTAFVERLIKQKSLNDPPNTSQVARMWICDRTKCPVFVQAVLSNAVPSLQPQGDSKGTRPKDQEPVRSGSIETEPIATEPVKTKPFKIEPAETESVKIEPVETESVKTEVTCKQGPSLEAKSKKRPKEKKETDVKIHKTASKVAKTQQSLMEDSDSKADTGCSEETTKKKVKTDKLE